MAVMWFGAGPGCLPSSREQKPSQPQGLPLPAASPKSRDVHTSDLTRKTWARELHKHQHTTTP
eukprot:362858-Karenia_brevis.AAC.1